MEIGSFYNLYFNKNPFSIKKHHGKQDLFFASGRIAIKYIVEKLGCKSCLIPNYLCSSVYQCFDNFDYYKIQNNFEINIKYLSDLINNNNYDLILIINFFGYIDKNITEIKNICKKHDILILEDFTHNLFSNNLYGDICISSFRKTLPTPFGSIVKINSSRINIKQSTGINLYYIYLNIVKILGSILKNISYFKWIWRPMLIYCENNVKNLNYNGFDYINHFFYNYYYDINILTLRKQNIAYLKNSLSYTINKNFNNTYFCFILNCRNQKYRDELLRYLINKNIYCPIYWPLDFDKNNKCNNYINKTVLMVPIDQRYNKDNMKYIIDCILFFNDSYKSFCFHMDTLNS